MKTQVQQLVEQGITDPVLISMQLQIKRTRVETALAWIEQEQIKKTRTTPKKSQSRAPVKTACWTTMPLVSIDDATQTHEDV